MTGINYVFGDATQPGGEGDRYIIHVCNNVGLWGAGFTAALSERWTLPEIRYRAWAVGAGHDRPFRLGENQYVRVERDLVVVNMIAQHGVRSKSNRRPLNYAALATCMWPMRTDFGRPTSIHMPRIGCGLAGGDWMYVEPLITDAITRHGIPVTVYDLPES